MKRRGNLISVRGKTPGRLNLLPPRAPAPPRRTHYHPSCAHWCAGYGCQAFEEKCRKCRTADFNHGQTGEGPLPPQVR